MARTILAAGACPVCADAVARTVTLHHGLQRETFHCPRHGSLSYSPHDVPLAALHDAGQLAPGAIPAAMPVPPVAPAAPAWAAAGAASLGAALGLDWVQ